MCCNKYLFTKWGINPLDKLQFNKHLHMIRFKCPLLKNMKHIFDSFEFSCEQCWTSYKENKFSVYFNLLSYNVFIHLSQTFVIFLCMTVTSSHSQCMKKVFFRLLHYSGITIRYQSSNTYLIKAQGHAPPSFVLVPVTLAIMVPTPASLISRRV